MRRMRLSLLVAALAVVAAAAGGAAVSSPGTQLIAGIPQRGTVLGSPGAPVTLLQYEDLGCTHCLEYMEDAFRAIVKEYVRTGRVKIDFRGLGVVAPASDPALRYVLAAGRQNRLWHLVELFYENQERLDEVVNDAAVTRLVKGTKGLDTARLLRDARSDAVSREVRALLKESVQRKVRGAPWFFVRRDSGPLRHLAPTGYDAASFTSQLDRMLAGR